MTVTIMVVTKGKILTKIIIANARRGPDQRTDINTPLGSK